MIEIPREQLEKMLEKSKKEYIDCLIKHKDDFKMFHSGRINVLCTLLGLDESEYFYQLITEAKKKQSE